MRTLKELAQLTGGTVEGDGNLKIDGVASLNVASPGHISFIASQKYLKDLNQSKASAFIVPQDLEKIDRPVIKVKKVHLALAKILDAYYPKPKPQAGVHPGAVLGKNVKLGKDVSIYPFVYIGDNAEIGDRVIIFPFVFIGNNSKIGEDSVIYSNVSIYHDVSIGKRAIAHSGMVIGADGFGFVSEEGKYQKIPQVGKIVIEDDVEIGANACVDRATLDFTKIGAGTKIDNLVQVAHNVQVGENCILVSQCGISGSCKIGKNVVIAGQAGLADHVEVGDNSMILAQAGVGGNLPANSVVLGSPAISYSASKRAMVSFPKLPEALKRISELEKRIEELEKKVK